MEKKLVKILENISAVCLVILGMSVGIQVVTRELLHISAVWTTEVGRAAFIAVVFLGTPILISENRQMAITLLQDTLRKHRISSLMLNIVNDIFIYFFLLTLAYGAFIRTGTEWRTKIPTVEWLTYGYLYLIVFVASMCMIFMQVLRTKKYAVYYLRQRKGSKCI